MSRDNAYLCDILNAAPAIQRFVAGVTRKEFFANEEKHEAVIRKFEIIGEATKRLSADTRAKLPGIPWHLAAGMRDVLIHDYDDVNLSEVWDATHQDLPELIRQIEAYLATQPPPS